MQKRFDAHDDIGQHNGLTLIITALQIEANPWIEAFGLKKDSQSTRIPIYKSDHYQLAISGVGAVPAAIATSMLLNPLAPHTLKQAHLFNIGLCGSPQHTQALGSIVLGNSIQDTTTGRTFIPDVFTRHDFEESSITTVAQPVNRHTQGDPINSQTVYEMEAAGVYQAAMIFLAPHQLHFLKIVSDHLEGVLLEKTVVRPLLEKSVAPIKDYIAASRNTPSTQPFELNTEQSQLLAQVIAQLKLTQTQSIQLREAAKACAFQSPKNLTPVCRHFVAKNPKDRNERNALFAQLVTKLYSA